MVNVAPSLARALITKVSPAVDRTGPFPVQHNKISIQEEHEQLMIVRASNDCTVSKWQKLQGATSHIRAVDNMDR